jgi:hypothetical protein
MKMKPLAMHAEESMFLRSTLHTDSAVFKTAAVDDGKPV